MTQPTFFTPSRLAHTLGVALLCWAMLFPGAPAAAEIRVGIYQNPPKIFIDESGRASGFFPEVLNDIAQANGWRLSYQACHWEHCLEMLIRGELDLLPDVAWSEARAQLFDFNTEMVLYNWSTIYRQPGINIHSLADLDGLRLAVMRGSIQYEALQRLALAASITPVFVEVTTPAQILQLAREKQVDAILLNRLFATEQRRALELKPTHLVIEQSHLHFAAPRDRHPELLQTIDQHLQNLKQTPQSSYYRALSTWIESAEPPARLPGWVFWLLQGMLLVLAVMLIVFILQRALLRRSQQELDHINTAKHQSEQMFHTLFEHSADAILLYNGDHFTGCNRAALEMFAYPSCELMATVHRDQLFPSHQPSGELSAQAAERLIAKAITGGTQRAHWLHRRANGEVFPSEVTLVPVPIGTDTILQVTIRDLSRQQAQEQTVATLSRTLRTLSQVHHALIHAPSEQRMLESICRILVEEGGYAMAWVGYAQFDDQRTILPMAQTGFPPGYLDGLALSWGGNAANRHPSALAIRHTDTITHINILQHAHHEALHDEARKYHYHSIIALPLIRENSCFGVLTIYGQHTQPVTADELLLLRQLTDDLAFGIRTARLQDEQTGFSDSQLADQQQLQQALQQTINAFVVMLELRDPYTAGHQRRTATLAVAIGRELGLDEVRLEGLRFSAILHDIGNIQVPSEILIRPGRLNHAEMGLMRSHAEAGYTILRDIQFPWPVAEIVRSHHERQDGSGYPHGLRGEQIPLESRIIGVADVVEAMLSHRPYRPAMRQDETLAELQQGRGTLYDPDVVDACIRLFVDKGYHLKA